MKTLVAATVPVAASCMRFLIKGDPDDIGSTHRHDVGDDELVAPGTLEDAPPGFFDEWPGAQDRPTRVSAHDLIGVIPALAHRVEVAPLVSVVEGFIGREYVVEHVRTVTGVR